MPVIARLATFRSANAEPTLNSNLSVVSFHRIDASSAVPRSIVIPAEPSVTPAPDSPLFKTIVLSSIVVLVEEIEVTEPLTVKSPVTVTAPAKVADSSAAKVRTVWSALSSIPVEAKLLIVPPSILSPDSWSFARVKVAPETLTEPV